MNKGFSWIIHYLLFALIVCLLSSQAALAANELKYAGDDAYCDLGNTGATGGCEPRVPRCYGASLTNTCRPYWRYDSPLRIKTKSPADGVTGVLETSNIVVTMGNGGALKGAGFIYIKKTSDNSTVESFNAATSSALTWGSNTSSVAPFHGADNVLTINPTIAFPSSTSLYILIDSGAIKNFVGTGFAGLSLSSDWNFTTGDSIDPTLVSTVPADNGATNTLTANLTATFSENIQRGTSGSIVLMNSTTGLQVQSFSITTSLLISISGATLTINPTSDLITGNSYYITIGSSAIRDMAANTYAGISAATTWNFTADTTAPTLSSTVPANGGRTASLSANLTATFNESIAMGTSGTIVLKKTIGDITIETFNIPSVLVNISGSATISINPAAPLEIDTDYYLTISSGVVKDIAGNIYAGYSNATTWNFTTDTTAPTIISTVPTNYGITNALNTNLTATFSENIQKGSGTIYLWNTNGGGTLVEFFNIPSSPIVSISGATLTINPTFDLVTGTSYYITIDSTAIKDMAGIPNNYAGITNSTTWRFTADTTAPTLSSTVPADNSSTNALTAALTATFNENIQEGSSGTIVLKKTSGDVTVETFNIPSDRVYVSSAATISIYPTADLEVADYYLTMSSGSVEDIAGNDYAGYSDTSTWNFTVETTAPTLTSTVPADDGFINTAANLTATFNENIQIGTGTIVLRNSGGTHIETFTLPDSQVTISGATVTINPASNLTNATSYYITIGSSAIKDLAGNSYAGFSNATTWNFTADSTAPTKISTSPLDGATEVAVATNLSITLSENVQKGSGNITIKKTSDNSEVQTIDVTNSIVTVSGTTVTIDPSADLLTDIDYYITIANGAIKDLASNNYVGISSNLVWNFITTDTIAPTLISTVPPDDGYGASVSADITATFSENIQNGSNVVFLKKSSDNSPVSTVVTKSGATVTINPTSDLVANIGYYVTVTSGGIEDLAGNDYAGISDATTWNFISVDNIRPTVVSFYPADNATGASISGDLIVTFSENIQKGTGNIVIYKTTGGTAAVHTIAIGSALITVSGNTMTINPSSDLSLNFSYYVTIANTAIKDFAATPNTYLGIAVGDTSTWNFTTGDTDHFFWGGD